MITQVLIMAYYVILLQKQFGCYHNSLDCYYYGIMVNSVDKFSAYIVNMILPLPMQSIDSSCMCITGDTQWVCAVMHTIASLSSTQWMAEQTQSCNTVALSPLPQYVIHQAHPSVCVCVCLLSYYTHLSTSLGFSVPVKTKKKYETSMHVQYTIFTNSITYTHELLYNTD